MSLILSGTNGLSDVDGSAATPAIRGTDTNTGIFFPDADTVGITTGGTERARVDSSGNLGLGVTPSAWNSARKAIQVGAGSSLVASTTGASFTEVGANTYLNAAASDIYIGSDFASKYRQANGAHIFYTAASGTAGNAITFTQAMTLDASGNLGVGTTSPGQRLSLDSSSTNATSINITNAAGASGNFNIGVTGSSSTWGSAGGLAVRDSAAGATRMFIDSSGNLLVGAADTNDSSTGFKYNNTRDGAGHPRLVLSDSGTTNTYVPLGVYSTGASAYRFYVGAGGTVYATSTTITAISSDARLKQDIVDYDKGLSEVLSLRPRYFAYKTEPDIKLAGFISQEVQTVMPEAIEPTLEDPEMMTYSIDWHPLLVKAIQEQQALIAQLQADVAALKGTP